MHCAENEHLEQLCSAFQPADYKQRLKGKIPPPQSQFLIHAAAAV